MKDLKYIQKLRNSHLIYEKDAKRIWKLYKKIFTIYPYGKITCGTCINDSIDNLYKYLLLKQIS